MTTTLALLRHGETPWSRVKRLQGRTDVGLSETGAAMLAAHMLPPECSELPVCTSPLVRCTQTAAQLRLVTPVIEARLIEMSWGQWEGRTQSDLRSELGPEMAENEARGWDFMPPGGESPRQVWQRVRPWLSELAALRLPTLAVTHRGVMRVIFARATGWDMLGKPPAKLDWTTLQLFSLDEQGLPAVQRLNLPLPARQL
ncbi:histidine phosphatase family protein [Roseateles sp.]|uniref:histidine phosphatase family protein n=1 Tax=Roseateles sp. TaxID=1971397 RepID=UPI00286A01EE|nr:histidine phosphatase family protein [Roseateles sp.]